MRTYRTLALGAASLALIMSACTSGGSGSPSESAAANKPDVSVGSAGFWESAVTAEMYAQALEAKGYTVDRHLEIGERPALHAAFDAEEINLMPEYLGGLSGQGLGIEELSSDAQTAWDNMQDALEAKGWVSFDFSPGTDADGFAVRQETADEFDLVTGKRRPLPENFLHCIRDGRSVRVRRLRGRRPARACGGRRSPTSLCGAAG